MMGVLMLCYWYDACMVSTSIQLYYTVNLFCVCVILAIIINIMTSSSSIGDESAKVALQSHATNTFIRCLGNVQLYIQFAVMYEWLMKMIIELVKNSAYTYVCVRMYIYHPNSGISIYCMTECIKADLPVCK